MREEKGRRRKEKENDSEGRSRRGRKRRRKGRRYASGIKPPKPKMLATSLCSSASYQRKSIEFQLGV